MSSLLGALLAVIVEALVKVFTSQIIVKAILAAFTYVFLFTIIPLLIQFLVPSTLMNAMDTYTQMLKGGLSQMICAGSMTPVSNGTVTCSAVVGMTQFGQGVAYMLNFFQFTSALQCFLPAMAVTFLFKRI